MEQKPLESKRLGKPPGIRIKPREGMWINYQLRLAGIRQSDLARKLGVTPSTIATVLYGTRTSARVAATLYRVLGYSSFADMIAAARGEGETV